jgi:RES domain-containing protein
MIVYRLTKQKYARDLSGIGAKLAPGRWNQGLPVLYTAQSIALAALEVLVHVPAAYAPKQYELIEIELPEDALVETLDLNKLPTGWNNSPPESKTKRIGEEWLQSMRSLVLRVPSVIVPEECVVLINPLHPDHSKVKVRKTSSFAFDGRLFE